MVTVEEIEKLAELARIELTSKEKERIRKDMEGILEYVSQIKEAHAAAKPAERASFGKVNVMRDDATPHESGIHTEALLSAAPARQGNYVKVKKIL